MLGCAIDSIHEVDSTPHRDASENFTPHIRTKLPQKFHSSGQIPGLALLDALCGVSSSLRTSRPGFTKVPFEEQIPDLASSGNTLFSQDLTPHTQRSFPKIPFRRTDLWLGYSGHTLFGSLRHPLSLDLQLEEGRLSK